MSIVMQTYFAYNLIEPLTIRESFDKEVLMMPDDAKFKFHTDADAETPDLTTQKWGGLASFLLQNAIYLGIKQQLYGVNISGYYQPKNGECEAKPGRFVSATQNDHNLLQV